jgi:alanine racemase
MNEQHTLGIFEAGISQAGEMQQLEKIIQPVIGILTNIGEAHSEGFADKKQKLEEKLQLFVSSKQIIANGDEEWIRNTINDYHKETLYWGKEDTNDLQIITTTKELAVANIQLLYKQKSFDVLLPFTDDASVENAITCCALLLHLGYSTDEIAERIKQLQPVNMRLELKKGINQCTIINDSYSNDLNSLEIALNFLDQQAGAVKKTVILSDVLQSGQSAESLYNYIIRDVKKHGVSRLIGIGPQLCAVLEHNSFTNDLANEFYPSTENFIQQFLSSRFKEETILIKGARVFGFEQIVQLLEQKVHQTVLEINLNAVAHNVKAYQKLLHPSVKIMGMVKAFAYGSGGAEIAGMLQFHKLDYLGVAYADEGVELRKAGISLPIMVMNPEESSFEAIVEHNLEPDMYSVGMLHAFEAFLQRECLPQYPIHIEIETGMNRLGFAMEEIEQLSQHLASSSIVKVQTVFSHLASSEDPTDDAFTIQQFDRYKKAVAILQSKLGYTFLQHIANTAAIARLPQLQLNMVRLGIGMYGIDSTLQSQLLLQPAATLKSTIAQLKHLKAGESVSYNRKGVVQTDSIIATVRIGYADGYSRRLGNGVGKMYVKGKLAPVIGTVCMDMTMIDVTNIAGIAEGDEVIIFGKELPVQEVARWAETIPYEVMTGISQRVQRVYFEE